MTEEDAKTKFCCGPDGTGTPRAMSYNAVKDRMEPVGHLRMCIGSACMAWRTIRAGTGSMTTTGPYSVVSTIYLEDGGYCGLAGDPR